MPTRTTARTPRRTASPTATRRFSRSTPPPARRFGRATAKPKGRTNMLIAKASKPAAGKAGKAKPALALMLAGAGAFLGRKQARKRKETEAVVVTRTAPADTPVAPPAVPPTAA